MRLRIRTLILAFLLVAAGSPTVSACGLFGPFRALFGCGCYPHAGYGMPPAFGAPGYGCYQPAYPGLMSPCGPCAAPCPLIEVFRLPRCLPMPAIFQQCLDPCGMQQCAMPMMQAPAIPYQPVPMAAPSYYSPPVMPMMPMNSGCLDDCGAETAMSGFTPQPHPVQTQMPMHEQMMPLATGPADSCCDGEEMMSYGAGLPSWGGMPVNAWTPHAAAWTPQTVYPGVGFPTRSWHASLPPSGMGVFGRPRVARREARRMEHQMQQQMRRMNRHTSPVMAPSPFMAPSPVMGYPYYGPMASPYGYSQPMPQYPIMPQYQPIPQYQPMPQHQAQPLAEPTGYLQVPQISGDIMGDHEMLPSSAAIAPAQPIAFRAPMPLQRASLSRPLLGSSSQYSKSVR